MRKRLEFHPKRFLFTIACFAVVINNLVAEIFPNLKTGDLIFQGEGNTEFSKAIANSTSSEKDSVNFIHVGIIEVVEDSIRIIEASSEAGVRIIDLDVFLKQSPRHKGKPAVVVKRLDLAFPVEEAIKRAKSHLGEPYDWWYLPENGKMYCSELVYESYLDSDGNKIFPAKPMNFRNPDGSMPEFWINLFQQLGRPIPEGLPGTNPNDLSRHPSLIEIKNY